MKQYIATAKQLRALLHGIPEASMQEVKTKAALIDFLKRETKLSVIDRGNWFYAVWKGKNETERPGIAIRADYDAVKGGDGNCRHLCGHDGHAAILVAFAKWISDHEPGRDIYLLFQPGEETGEGAMVCRELLKQEKIAELYGIHNIPGYPVGQILLRKGTFACASTGLAITLNGAPAHAAYPETGKNPSEAMAQLILKINGYVRQEHRGMILSTVIGVELGSRSYGVSASEGTLRVTVRAEFFDEFKAFLAYIDRAVAELAKERGLTFRIEETELFPATENHDAYVEKVRKAAKECGLAWQELEHPFRWSEDFGWYLQMTTGAFYGIGAGEKCPQLHTAEYEFPDEVIPYALETYKALCEDAGSVYPIKGFYDPPGKCISD